MSKGAHQSHHISCQVPTSPRSQLSSLTTGQFHHCLKIMEYYIYTCQQRQTNRQTDTHSLTHIQINVPYHHLGYLYLCGLEVWPRNWLASFVTVCYMRIISYHDTSNTCCMHIHNPHISLYVCACMCVSAHTYVSAYTYVVRLCE